MADKANQALRLISPAPNYTVSRIPSTAASGLYGGPPNPEGDLDGPNALVVAPNDVVVLVTNRTLYYYNPAEAVQRGAPWPGAVNAFGFAVGIAADSARAGVFYVADLGVDHERGAPHNRILTVTLGGFPGAAPGAFSTAIALLAGGQANFAPGARNTFDGVGTNAFFAGLGQVTFDAAAGLIYAVDFAGNLVRSIAPLSGAVTTVAGNVSASLNKEGDGNPSKGLIDGPLAGAKFRNPAGIAVVAPATLLVADGASNALRLATLGGSVFTVAGAATPGGGGFQDGAGAVAYFNFPEGLALLPSGAIAVADAESNAIRLVTCAMLPSPSASPAPPAPPAPPAAPASDNILGPVVVGGLRSGALAIIVVGAALVLAVGAALAWNAAALKAWLTGAPATPAPKFTSGGGGGGSGSSSAGAEAPSTPSATYSSLNSPSAPPPPGAAVVANPLASLPGGVQEWGATGAV